MNHTGNTSTTHFTEEINIHGTERTFERPRIHIHHETMELYIGNLRGKTEIFWTGEGRERTYPSLKIHITVAILGALRSRS